MSNSATRRDIDFIARRKELQQALLEQCREIEAQHRAVISEAFFAAGIADKLPSGDHVAGAALHLLDQIKIDPAFAEACRQRGEAFRQKRPAKSESSKPESSDSRQPVVAGKTASPPRNPTPVARLGNTLPSSEGLFPSLEKN